MHGISAQNTSYPKVKAEIDDYKHSPHEINYDEFQSLYNKMMNANVKDSSNVYYFIINWYKVDDFIDDISVNGHDKQSKL